MIQHRFFHICVLLIALLGGNSFFAPVFAEEPDASNPLIEAISKIKSSHQKSDDLSLQQIILQEAEDGPAAGLSYIGYSWPFPKEDISKRFGPSPVLVEYFSDPECVYCVVGDEFINDLAQKTNLILLACHVNKLKTLSDNPLLSADCTNRQIYHSLIWRWRVQIPQFIFNGKYHLDGLSLKEAVDLADKASHDPSMYLENQKLENRGKQYRFAVTLPEEELGQLEDFNDRVYVKLIEYKKPLTATTKEGMYKGRTADYHRIVSRVIPLENWDGKAGEYIIKWTPSEHAAGAVASFQRQDNGMLFFTEIKR